MSITCTARYVWTQDELVTGMQRHYSVKFRNEFRMLLKVTCALLLAFTLIVVLVSIVYPYDKPAPYWSLILTMGICIYGLVYDRINVWFWKRNFRKRPDAETDVEWVFAEDVLKTKTSIGEGTIQWKAFIKVAETRDGFLFYSMKNFFHWIPFHSFDSMDCIGNVRELIVKSGCQVIQQK